jgi:RNA polymerase sigma-70 factor (ECF subfamily)
MNDRVLANIYSITPLMIDSQPEQECLGKLDSQAITAIYNQYFLEVFRYVQYRLGDIALAEDISSEVFLCLLNAIKNGGGPGTNSRGWLIGTARHLVVDHIRQKYRNPRLEISEALKSDEAGPSQQAEQRDHWNAVHLAIIELTEDQQQVLALRFGQGYSLEETAAIMKKKINAIKALQFRALNALQRRIGKENE